MKKFTILLLVTLLLSSACGLTAQEAATYCHCDLTSSFCDFNCCCDKDCSSAISTDCFNRLSTIFCLNSSYYYKIDSTLTKSGTDNCYYYNQTTTMQQQVTMSLKQINQIAANFQKTTPLPSNSGIMYSGYKIGDVLTISNKNTFNFMDANGDCITGTGTITSSIRWRVNSDFTCNGNSNSINMFDDIFGETINVYSEFNDRKIVIPSPSNQYNQAIVYIFIARFGSNSVEYIQDVRVVGKIAGNTANRYLRIRFIDPQVDLEQQDSHPSFFPQIPYDIFYPIYQIAYSF